MPFGDFTGYKFNKRKNRLISPAHVNRLRKARSTVTGKVEQVAKKVNRLSPEVKYVYSSYSFNVSNGNYIAGGATSIVRQINVVTAGQNNTQRNGSTIRGKSLQIRWNLLNSAMVNNSCYYRICVVYDTRPNKALPLIQDLFVNFLNPFNQITFKNPQYKGRFKFLMDLNSTIGGTGDAVSADVTGGNIPALRNGVRNINLNGKKTLYDVGNNDGLITGITDGSYILLAWCSVSDGGAATQPLLSINIKYNFTDV